MSNDALLTFLEPGPERGGVVLEDGTIVELKNQSTDEDGYAPDPADLLPHVDRLAATWHTHPGATANPSVEDADTFVMWPDLIHYIVGVDGVRAFHIKHGAVVNA